MPRPPVGKVPQALSNAALAAYVASRLAGVESSRQARDQWLQHDLGLDIRSNGLERAACRTGDATRRWLLVDEVKLPLDLDKALAVFPGRGKQRPDLLKHLGSLGVTRQTIVTRARRDVVCVILYWRKERDAVFAALEGLDEPFVWEEILGEERHLEARVWAVLAQRMAQEDSLLTGPASLPVLLNP